MRFHRLAASIASILCVLLLGCSTLGLGAKGTERIQQSGQLRVGMAGDYPPMNVRTADGRLIGLDADLAAALASILEVELVLTEMPFSRLLDAVADGEIDIAISGITMTPRRNLKVAFAGPYYLSRKAILAKPELLEGVESVADLRGRSLRVAAVSGGTSEALVLRALPDSEHVFEKDQAEAFAKVLYGEADVLVADDPVIRFGLLRRPDAGLTFVESRFSAEPIGIAISADDPLFVNLVENYLHSLEHIGLLDTLREKWFESPEWIGSLP
ncbi:MAG TPA: transporter substrate-binding domain-containing protein [Myxococcota bacterium]|nr:transporter substrate-binding domain-containing protein [Myxococcota bacterium]